MQASTVSCWMQCYIQPEGLLLILTAVHLTECMSVIRPHVSIPTLLTAPPWPSHMCFQTRLWPSLSQTPYCGDEGADGGLPSLSTCLSKIRAGSFLWPLILGFKVTKNRAADRKHGHESPWGARHVTHIPGPVFRSQSCHDITAKNKSFPGSAIVGFRFDGRYPDGRRDPQVETCDPLQQPHVCHCILFRATAVWTLVLLPADCLITCTRIWWLITSLRYRSYLIRPHFKLFSANILLHYFL